MRPLKNTFSRKGQRLQLGRVPMMLFSTAVTSDGQMTVHEMGDVNMDGGITASGRPSLPFRTRWVHLIFSKDQKSLADAKS